MGTGTDPSVFGKIAGVISHRTNFLGVYVCILHIYMYIRCSVLYSIVPQLYSMKTLFNILKYMYGSNDYFST